MRAPPVALALFLFGVACQTNPSPSTGTSSICPLPSGNFTESFSTVDSGAACPPQPDQTLVLNGSESFLEPTNGEGVDGGDTTCATDVDTATCTYSANCTTSVEAGTALVVLTSVTFEGDTAHGRRTVTPNTCSPDVCLYDVTITRSE
jgi:hypothetical protein